MAASGGAGTKPARTMNWRVPARVHAPAAVCLLAMLLAAALAGCGRRVLRSADVESGDYYTTEEFRHLSDSQREEYCAELAAEADMQDGRRESAERRRAEAAESARAASGRAQDLLTEIGRLETGVGTSAALEAGVRPAAASVYVARPGDSLWSIAARTWGDGRLWPRILEANRGRLPHPDRLPVGTELTIPGRDIMTPPGKGGS